MTRRTAILVLDLPDTGVDPRGLIDALAQSIRYTEHLGSLKVEHVEPLVIDLPAGDVASALRTLIARSSSR